MMSALRRWLLAGLLVLLPLMITIWVLNWIIGTLDQMRAQSPRANIMNVHAAAYTSQEIALIADYFDQQGD